VVRTSLIRACAIVVVAAAASCGGNASSPPPASSSTSSPPTASASGVPAGFATYTNPSPAFTIVYPQEWSASTTVSGAVVVFLAPASDASDQFRENVNVLRQTVNTGMTLERYTSLSLASVGQVVQNFNQLNLSTTTLSGMPAQRIEYTGDVNGKNYHFFAEWIVTGTDAWVLTYTAEENAYQQYLPDAQTTITSFQLD
jgi:hypothetical protein